MKTIIRRIAEPMSCAAVPYFFCSYWNKYEHSSQKTRFEPWETSQDWSLKRKYSK